MAKLCVGDLVLMVAQGSDPSWSPESSADPHPAIGFLASCEHAVPSSGIVHRAAGVETLTQTEALEPKSVLPCVFRVEAVLNKEDIVRVDLQRKLDSRALENEMAYKGYGTEVKLGQCIRLVHYHTNQVLCINVNERGVKSFTMKIGFESPHTFNAACDVPAREQWLDSWLEVQAPVKTKMDGDTVLIEDVVHLYSARWERYLDVATSRLQESILDVVAGKDKTRWQLVPFANHEPSVPALRGGDILRFCHVESEHVLELASDVLALTSRVTSNALWAVEPLHAKWGGKAIALDVFQLRHVATGKLLAISANAPLCVSASSTDNGPATFFKLASKHGGSSTTFHIQHEESGVWLCGVAGNDDATIPLHCCRTVRDSDVFRVHLPSATEVFVLLDVLFTKHQFARHCAQLQRVPNVDLLAFQDVQPLEICLRAVHNVLREHPSLKFILWDQSVLASLLDNFAAILHTHQGVYQRHAELRTCVRALCFLIKDYVTDDPTSQRTIHPYLPMLQDLLGANEA
ncbi:hypothetical protein SPRG_17875, partial [Saprolegnia parasitica CBS 223.65]